MYKKLMKIILAYNGDYKKLLNSETSNIPIINSQKKNYAKIKRLRIFFYIFFGGFFFISFLVFFLKRKFS